MLATLRSLRPELRPMLRLAAPVVMAELGWMTMGIVDTLMVGRLSAEAIGAVGIGSSLFIGTVIFAMGLTLGMDTLVSQSFGSRDLEACHRWLLHGVALGLACAVPAMALLVAASRWLGAWGLEPDVLALTEPYVEVLVWSTPPLLVYAALRRYLQAMGVVRPLMTALIAANVMNAVANWILVFGALGMPALGVAGAAWATVLSRLVMMGWLLAVIVRRERGRSPGLFETELRLEWARLRVLLTLGLPAAIQITLEVGVFAAATALAGRLPASALAAHQIAINIAALTFMVPLGVSSAGAVRVGHAVGAGDSPGARRAGWTALALGAAFMCCSATVFLLVPRLLIGAFTHDAGVLGIGATLLMVAAVFQLFDGIQVVATGVLRGLGDTRTPMLWNLAGHWILGLPLGYWLCFTVGLGVVGLWMGLSAGLIVCGVALLAVWVRKTAPAAALQAVGGR
jgi:MATE family, multidrug efflux pump